MPQADGTILIDTEINADGMKAGSKEVEAAVRRMANSVNDLGTKARTALNKQVDSFAKLNKEYAAQAQKVDELKKKVAEYGAQKIPTAEYQEIQAQIDQATKRMNQLIAAQERYLNVGGKSSSSQYKKMQYDIDDLANTIKYAEGELKDLEASGKAFTFGNQTKQAAEDMEKLAAAERKLSDMNNRLGTSYSSIKGQVNDYKNSLLKTDEAQKKTSASGNKVAKSLSNTAKASNKASFGIGKMLGTSILFSFTFQAINGALTALKDGFTNLAQYSSSTNNSISMLWSSLERLKNSLATAFAPILDVVAPILSKFIDMLATAASYVSMFFAFLSGKSTYTRAIAVQKDYAGSLEDTASGASDAADATNEAAEAAEGYLSPLDEINKLDKKDTSGAGGSGGGGVGGGEGSGPLFEEVPIDNKFASLLDSVLDKLKEIRDIFMDGFWDGLGDYKPILEELKKDLSSIGSYLTDIFTDADVKAAAQKFVNSFIYNVGKIAGAVSRIGLTLAVFIVGGIESYLSENVDRIKSYLVSAFDISSEIANILGDLSKTVSDIISRVFSSQMAQDLSGDIIGVFQEAFMSVNTLALSFGRDILNLIAQPIIKNKDLIADALYETIEPLEKITQSIEDFVKNLADKILAVYDEHVKPFIDSVADGLSEITSVLLESYNEYIAPVLDKLATKFDKILNGPVGDAISGFIDLIGKLMDSLKILWESVLVPFISWISANVLPVIAPIIEFLGTTFLDFIGAVSGAISGVVEQLSGVIDFLTGVFTGDWSLAFSGLQQIAEGFKNEFNAIFDFIRNNILQPFDDFLSGVFTFDWVENFGVLGYVLEGFSRNVENIWNGIKEIFSGVVNFVNGVFSGDWSRAWEGIRQIFKGIWDSLVGIVKSPINSIIGLINGLISGVVSGINGIIGALNNFHVDLPGWLSDLTGMESFGFNIGKISAPQIPYLASGAVIPPNNKFLAVLGDQKQGTNIEAPESLIRKIMREELSRQKTGGGSYAFTAQINRRTLFEEFIKEAQLQQMRTGKNPFELA